MQVTQLVRLFCSHYPQADFPAKFWSFLEEQEKLGHPIRRVATGQPLLAFLEGLGVSRETCSVLLDQDSRWVLKPSFPDLLACTPAELDAYFADRFETVFALQETVLDSEMLTGFNRHGREHLRSVTQTMLALLREVNAQAEIPAPVDARTQNEAMIAGYLHDIGNLMSRKEHGIYGIYLVSQLFTDVDRDPQTLASFLRVLESVLFHEVEFGSRMTSLGDLSPVTLSLIVADKTDVSFRRVSSKSNVPEAIWDAHMLVNLLTGASRLVCRKRSFDWEIHFKPKLHPDEANQFSALLKRGERVWVPADWQKLYRTANIEYVLIFQATFLRVYFSRLAFAIRAMFALKPSLTTFRLVIEDDERGVSLNRIFTRDDYEAKVKMIANNLFKNNGGESA